MSQDPTLARRDLLRGAAVLVGGAALGLSPVAALANVGAPRPSPSPTPAPSPNPAPVSVVSVGYWDGHRFVAAGLLAANGQTLDRVQVTVTSVEGGGFSALEAHAPNPELGPVPFTLWVTPPQGTTRSGATLTSAADGSLLFAFYTKDKTRYPVLFASNALREGTYVVVSGLADWSTYRLQVIDGTITTTGPLPHVRIDVEPA